MCNRLFRVWFQKRIADWTIDLVLIVIDLHV